jgi:hypothetical protein
VRSTIQRLGSTTKVIRALDDLRSQVRQDFFQRVVELAPLIAGVSEQRLQERIHPEQGCKQQDAAVAILDVSGRDDGVEQQTQLIYQNVALLALDLLARIIAMRSMQAPLFRRFSRSGCRRWQRSGGRARAQRERADSRTDLLDMTRAHTVVQRNGTAKFRVIPHDAHARAVKE